MTEHEGQKCTLLREFRSRHSPEVTYTAGTPGTVVEQLGPAAWIVEVSHEDLTLVGDRRYETFDARVEDVEIPDAPACKLRTMLKEGVMLGDDCVDVETLLDPAMTEESEILEVLEDAGFERTEIDHPRAFVKRVANSMPKLTLRKLAESLDEDLLDPEYPIEAVEEELREAGLDPEKVGERGRELARRLLSKPKVVGGVMVVRAYDVLSQAISDGVHYGWTRAHKHVEKPAPDAILESIEREVINAICEWFTFDPVREEER